MTSSWHALLEAIGMREVDLDTPSEASDVSDASIVDEVLRLPAPAAFTRQELARLFAYRVPKVSPDGGCSFTHELEPTPFNIVSAVHHEAFPDADGSLAADDDADDAFTSAPDASNAAASPAPLTDAQLRIAQRQWRLQQVIRRLHERTSLDWLGVYKTYPSFRMPDGSTHGPALMKEAYTGEPSRALFPLTEAFAAGSNNSWVGLHGRARVIDDTFQMPADQPYYECSSKVRSELCVPLLDLSQPTSSSSRIVGIIDAESWKPHRFATSTPQGRACVVQVLRVAFDLVHLGLL